MQCTLQSIIQLKHAQIPTEIVFVHCVVLAAPLTACGQCFAVHCLSQGNQRKNSPSSFVIKQCMVKHYVQRVKGAVKTKQSTQKHTLRELIYVSFRAWLKPIKYVVSVGIVTRFSTVTRFSVCR